MFVNTKRSAEQLNNYLQANGYKTALLSGDVPQEKRQSLLNAFQENKVTLMIATDVAARGLHIPDVSHIFNYDLPQDAEDYVHRIGRTARFGASGESISFICEEYAYSMPDIEDFIGEKISVEAINDEILAKEVKQPEKKPVRKNYQNKRAPKQHRDNRSKPQTKTTAPASAPENLQSQENQ